ncbi:MAG: glycosyltransferase [Candidatus Promineifilaceae bacterium]
MRIVIIALGSRGDVQPYIALGKGLEESGHFVRLVSHPDFEALAHLHGLAFWPVEGNVQDVVQNEEMRELLEKGNFIAITRQTAREAQRVAIRWAEDGLAACQGMDLIIAGIGGLFIALSFAEKLDLLIIQAYLVPFTPTTAFASVLLPPSLSGLGGFLNQASHHLTRQMMWQGFRSADKSAREQVLGLSSAPFWGPYNAERLQQTPILYGFSPSVVPKPPDWGENIHVTGYWFLDPAADWTPPSSLMEFLQGDSAPVYIGFGSMAQREPEETADLVLQALAQTQKRAILLSGWGGLRKANLPDTVFMADSIPHSWLFPRVAAVVHHGGAGTTAAGLRAGVPSVIIPFFGDQFFWGRRVAELGVGPQPIPRKKLTVESLTQAIQEALTDQTMRQRAAGIGAKIQAEDGIAGAVKVVQTVERVGIS